MTGITLAGVEIALTLLAVGLLMWSSRQDQGQAVRDGEASSDQNGASLREAVRTPTFWIIAAIVFLGTSGVFGASFQVLPRYADLGVAGAVIPVIAAMAGLGTLVGRLSSGFLLDYIDARSIACVTLGIGATGIFGLAMMGQGQSTLIVCLPPLLLGAALGAESDILPYMVRRYFGPRQFALIYNRLLIAFQSGAVVGPLALSLAFDRFSQMEGALVAIGACCLVAAVLAVLLPPPAGRTWVAQNARDLPTR